MGTHGSQKKAFDPLELESQADVSLTRMLGTELGSCGKAADTTDH